MAPKKKTDVIPTTDHEQARKDFEQITQPAPLPTFDNFSMIMEAKRRARQLREIQAKEKLTKELQRANDLQEREQSEPGRPGMVEFQKIVFSPGGKDKFLSLLEKIDCVTIEDGRYIISADTEEAAGRWAIALFIQSHLNNYIIGFIGKRANKKKQMLEKVKNWKLITANFSYRLKKENSIRPFNGPRLNTIFNNYSDTKDNLERFKCPEMEHVENIKS